MSLLPTLSSWPTHHLIPRKTSTRRRCVLLATGALAPIHAGHIQTLSRAAALLSSNDDATKYHVMGCYLSPSHDAYVGSKCQRKRIEHLTANHRVNMCQLAVEEVAARESCPVAVGLWEIRYSNGGWPDYPVVIKSLDNFLNNTDAWYKNNTEEGRVVTEEDPIYVFYVCGSDHAQHIDANGFRSPRHGLVVIPRNGACIPHNATRPQSLVYWCNLKIGVVASMSSTSVRRDLAAGEVSRVVDAIGVRVFKYLCQHSLIGASPKMMSLYIDRQVKVDNEEGECGNGETDKGVAKATEVISTNEDYEDLLDLSDAVDGLHAGWVQEGHREAVDGLEGTDVDAMRLGIHHGTQLGYELGYMQGVLGVLLPSNRQLSERCHETLVQVSKQLETFPVNQPASASFQRCLDKLRADFRKCCSQSKLKGINNGWKTTLRNKTGETKTF
jgi:hypothetical protein